MGVTLPLSLSLSLTLSLSFTSSHFSHSNCIGRSKLADGFFAPQLPAQAIPAAEEAEAAEGEEGSARQQRLRVHRIADCSFKLAP